MSRIYFHAEDADAEVRGPDRALFGVNSTDMLLAALHLSDKYGVLLSHERPWREKILSIWRSGEGGLLRGRDYIPQPEHLPTAIAVSSEGDYFALPDGASIFVSSCALNTMLAAGSDPLKLGARLHGQCEIHAYVEGPNRAWLADIIDEGRKIGFYRAEMGWESVATMLRLRDDGPVVTSYSVCDGFPDAGVVKEAGLWEPGPEHQGVYPNDYVHEAYRGKPWWDGDEWYEIPAEEQWALGMRAIREADMGLELTPEKWAYPDFHFGKVPVTGYNVAEYVATLPDPPVVEDGRPYLASEGPRR